MILIKENAEDSVYPKNCGILYKHSMDNLTGWNPVGKSYLLDLIFGTDFVSGSPTKSAFHSSSIDIQMTKNLFGELKEEAIRWGFIDCHGFSDIHIIQSMSQLLEIALIHVTHDDFIRNRERLDREISIFVGSVRYVYIFIRDSNGMDVRNRS